MTAPVPIPNGFPAQDYVTIGGLASPGKVTVQQGHSPRPWDIRKGYAMTGATIVPQGDDLATFTLHFEFWDESDMPLWYAYAACYFDKSVRLVPGSNVPKALSIQHPVLQAPPFRVTECVVNDCTTLENDGTGLWSCDVLCTQYRKPKPALAPPNQAIAAVKNPTPTAEDAADREIQAKLAQYNSLAQQGADSVVHGP
jgi:hypothetical protein